MTFNVGDRLVFNDESPNTEAGFLRNVAGRIDDEYICIVTCGGLYEDDLAKVTNTRTDEETTCYWWRFKKAIPVFKYNPDQAGDTEDDI
ncbi:hypothetical protein F67_I3_11_026 [Rhizobium phage RHph_I3_11]|nr:hypothetical protein F67_I3_11_026 [Rhizobium phage RHph_I3_11]